MRPIPASKPPVRSAAGPCLATRRAGRSRRRRVGCGRGGGTWSTSGPPAGASVAGGFFSLADERLKLGAEDYSPAVLRKIEYAGGNGRSFASAAEALG